MHKSDALVAFKRLSKKIINEKKAQIGSIRSDRGGELLNELLEEFHNQEGIRHEYLAPRTPQQNNVVK